MILIPKNQNMIIKWLLNLETQITNVNQLTKNIVLIVIKIVTVCQIVTKNNAMSNIKDTKIKDQEVSNNHSYNTSVLNPVTRKKIEMKTKMITLLEIMTVTNITKTTIPITKTDIEVIAENIHKIIIDLILDKDSTIDLQVHTHLDLDMTIIIKEELHLDPHIDHHTEIIPTIDSIPDQDIDRNLNHKETPLDDTIIHIDLHPDQEITDQDLEHLHKTDNKTE